MKSVFVLLLFCISAITNSQQLLTDVSGRPYSLKAYDNIKGSAYLFDEWKKANVTDIYGTTFLNLSLRVDLYANKIYFLHNNGPYEFITDMTEFEIFPVDGDSTSKMIFQKGFTIGDKVGVNKYAEVLVKGSKMVKVEYKKTGNV